MTLLVTGVTVTPYSPCLASQHECMQMCLSLFASCHQTCQRAFYWLIGSESSAYRFKALGTIIQFYCNNR